MKTEISRNSHDASKRYTGVYQQQGRMLTDADWNELTDIVKYRLYEVLQAIVGSGAPRKDGMRLVDDPAGPKLKTGYLYVDGIAGLVRPDETVPSGAADFPYNKQMDFPSPAPLPDADGDYFLYADMWERPVICLEDPDLRDPGLHGADTCTRTQTMVQIKWCPFNKDPEELSDNPPHGDATLTLTLRETTTTQDPCDPCAGEITLEPGRVGNYLFRLEVHDVQWSEDGITAFTLKWSNKNGAEQHVVETEPQDFKGDWIYEFYNDVSEKHLGMHLSSALDFPVRLDLQEGYPDDLASILGANYEDDKWYVRRWDGYCVLTRSGDSWSVSGKHRHLDLTTQGNPQDDGYVSIDTAFQVNLPALVLTLEIEGKTFVAGDYWLAPVREDLHQLNDDNNVTVVEAAAPSGIVHHYVKLTKIVKTGTKFELQPPHDDVERRRLAFPSLTDLNASDIGFTNACPTRFPDAENIQEALEALCNLNASDIDYEVPENCGDSDNPTVRSLLEIATGTMPVDAILSNLLCNFEATDLPIVKSGEVPELNLPQLKSVQDALNHLTQIDRDGRSCAWTVGETVGEDGKKYAGKFLTLKDAFQGLSDEQNITLCLFPGEYQVQDTLEIFDKRSIKITGSGVEATVVRLNEGLSFSADEIIFRDLTLDVPGNVGAIDLSGSRVNAQDCAFRHSPGNLPKMFWAKGFGGKGAEYSERVAVDHEGNVVIAGRFSGDFAFCDTRDRKNMEKAGSENIFIAKFSPDGEPQWARCFGGPGRDRAMGLAVDKEGNVIVVGDFEEEVKFDEHELKSMGGPDLFLVKLDGETGDVLWVRGFAGSFMQYAGVAVDGSLNIVITGGFHGKVDFEAPESPTESPTEMTSVYCDIFVAKFDGEGGVHLWSQNYQGTSDDFGYDLATDPDGNIVVTGCFWGRIDFGGGDLTAADPSADIFVLKLDATGKYKWSRCFGGPSYDIGAKVAIGPDGNVGLTGHFQKTIAFDGIELASMGHADILVANLDGDNGSPLWARSFGAKGRPDVGRGIAVDSKGNLVVTGYFGGTVDFGSGALRSGGRNDLFVAKFDGADGVHLWSRNFSSTSKDYGTDVAVDIWDNVVVTGCFHGTIDFDGNELTNSSGYTDIFVAKFSDVEVSAPLLLVRPRPVDSAGTTDLYWADNRMETTWLKQQNTAGTGALIVGPGNALALASNKVGGVIRDNTIRGHLTLMHDLPDTLDAQSMVHAVPELSKGQALKLHGNEIHRVVSKMAAKADVMEAFSAIIATDNIFHQNHNSLICGSLTLNGNQFPGAMADGAVAALVIGNSGVFVGNQAANPDAIVRLCMERKADAANLLRLVQYCYPYGSGSDLHQGIGGNLL